MFLDEPINLVDGAGRKRGRLALPKVKANPITKKEAETLRPGMIAALMDAWPEADRLATLTGAKEGRPECYVYRMNTEPETGQIVDLFLKLAQVYPAFAMFVRGGTMVHQTYGVGSVLFRNFTGHVMYYLENGFNPAGAVGILPAFFTRAR